MSQFKDVKDQMAKSSDDDVKHFLLRFLHHSQDGLELLINKTPTGPKRESLTEANIHVGAAILKLEEVTNG